LIRGGFVRVGVAAHSAVVMVGAVVVVGDGMSMTTITGGPVETSVNLSERWECKGVTSIERGFLDNFRVSDAKSSVGLGCSIGHLLGFSR